jgi:hypothetical protein
MRVFFPDAPLAQLDRELDHEWLKEGATFIAVAPFTWCLFGELVCLANPFYILLATVLACLLYKNDTIGRRCWGMPGLNPTRIAFPGQLMPVNESSRVSVDDGRKSGEVSEWARLR